MIGQIQDIYCDKCNIYLFTEKDVKDEKNPKSNMGKTVRENDKGNYVYDEISDMFICNECCNT